MRLYCEEARNYGDVQLPIGVPARQITVVLNPASNGGCVDCLNSTLLAKLK